MRVPKPATRGRHSLVVGGSGMLAGLCRRLARDGWQVSIVGRDRSKLTRATAGSPRVHPISVDYEQLGPFTAALRSAAAERGPIVLAVCWIRSSAPQSLRATADALTPSAQFFHVMGGQRSDASVAAIAELERRDGLEYRQVWLGVAIEHGRERWLTNDEISDGVYTAIATDSKRHLVGAPRHESTPPIASRRT